MIKKSSENKSCNTKRKSSRQKDINKNKKKENSSPSIENLATKSPTNVQSPSPPSNNNGIVRKVKTYYRKISNFTTTTAVNAIRCKEEIDDYVATPWEVRCTDMDDDYNDKIDTSLPETMQGYDIEDDYYSYEEEDDEIYKCSPFTTIDAEDMKYDYYNYNTSNSTTMPFNCCGGGGMMPSTNGMMSDSVRELLNAIGFKGTNLGRINSTYSRNQHRKQRKVRFSAIDLIHDNYDGDYDFDYVDDEFDEMFLSSIDDDDDNILLDDEEEVTISTVSTTTTDGNDGTYNMNTFFDNYEKKSSASKKAGKQIQVDDNDKPTFDHPLDILRKDGLDALSVGSSSSGRNSSDLANYVEKNGLTLVQQDINNCVLIMPNNSK